MLPLSEDNFSGSLPSAFAIHTFSLPSRSLTKTMRLPSGENFGCESNAMPLVMRRASPPSMGKT